MAYTQRYRNGRTIEINDTLSDDVINEPCPYLGCDENPNGFWTEKTRGKKPEWKCLACGRRWKR